MGVKPQGARLRKPLERAVRDGHPWLFRDSLVDLRARPGEVVDVVDRRGRWLARGLADAGPIGVRVWTTQDEPLDGALLSRRLSAAAALRDAIIGADTTAYRLLHGEGDRVPGVVCDVYGSGAVLVFDGDGARAWQREVTAALTPILERRGVSSLLLREGKRENASVTPLLGDPPTGPLRVREHGVALLVDPAAGQKTGLFLDHRESRRMVRSLSSGLRVLNLYGYTGGFSVAAGLGGATSVDTIDIAGPALELAARTWSDNGLPASAHTCRRADVPELLEEVRRTSRQWDLVISDPPSFAPRQSSVRAALGAYERLHAACLAVLAPGGLLLAASCSSHVTRDAFEETLRRAARAQRQQLQVLSRWGAPADHPRLLAFPEGDYLKVILARTLA